MRTIAAASLALAAMSLLVVAPAPAYDPWAWLLWGREAAEGRLSTAEGPAFKPLPVAACALLSVLGPAAPWLWVLLARAGALLAVLLAFRVGRRLAAGSVAGGLLAAAGVALTGQFLPYAAAGLSEGLLLGLALAGIELWRERRPRPAIACAAGCALLRVETWPFLLLAGFAAWRSAPAQRASIVATAVVVPLAWFVPELLGSGDLLRSGERARIPNPGQPALADVPALASLREAVVLSPWPVWLGVAVVGAFALPGVRDRVTWRTRAPVIAPAVLGLAWIALVAAMAQAGFSGEGRYALPGAALLAIPAAAGLVRLGAAVSWRHGAGVAVAVAVAVMLVPRAAELASVPGAQAHQWALARELPWAIRVAGGRDAVLSCGTPYVGRLRGPLMAYALDVAKRRVEPDARPRPPGTVFRSRLTRRFAPSPAAPASFERLGTAGPWEVLGRCPGEAHDNSN